MTINYTLRSETFAGRNFCRSAQQRNFIHFAGINFRREQISRCFAGINFHGQRKNGYLILVFIQSNQSDAISTGRLYTRLGKYLSTSLLSRKTFRKLIIIMKILKILKYFVEKNYRGYRDVSWE